MTEEMEKNFKEIEEMHKNGMLNDEEYAWQKKQLEDEMAREGGQAASVPPPIQQETASHSLEVPPPLPEKPMIHVRVGGGEPRAFEREEVIRKIRAGEIRRDARVWKKGMGKVWVDAGELPELEDHFGPPPPLPEMPPPLKPAAPRPPIKPAANPWAEIDRAAHERQRESEKAEARMRADAEMRARIAAQERAAAEARAQAALERGIKHLGNKNYDEAIKEYNEAIRLDPKNAKAYNGRGVIYQMKGQYDQAIKEFNEAIRLDPNDSWAYAARGGTYLTKGQYAQAVLDTKRALVLNPNDELAKSVLQKISGGDTTRTGIQNTNSAREKAQAALERGREHFGNRNYDQAISEYTEAIRLDPKNAMVYVCRGEAYNQKNSPFGSDKMLIDKAIKDFDEAIRLNPNDAKAYVGRGEAYYYNFQCDQAISDCTKAIRLDPNYAKAHALISYAYDRKRSN